MIRRVGRKNFQVYAVDFETHNDEESIAKKETSIWLGCLIDEHSKIDDPQSYFYTIDELLERLEALSSHKRKNKKESRKCNNVCIYDYNLAFEWSFILPVLIEKGFKFKEIIEEEDEYCFNTISTKSCSSVWNIQIKFGKKSGQVIFKDLAKIYGGGLGKVAKSFNLETQKGIIDYRKNRLHDYIVTQEEKEYCFKDVRIIIDILLIMNEKKDSLFFKASSMASYASSKMISYGFKSYKPYQQFRKMYPNLSKEENDFLRMGVEGGITYAPVNWQFVDIKAPILHIDAHQMHPSQAYEHLFPYGEGEHHIGEPTDYYRYINCCKIKISYSGVKLHSIIKLIGIEAIDEYELVLWDFEIPTMKKCYLDLKIEYIEYYSYKCRRLPWRKFYADNYNNRLIAKKNKDEFNVLYYKLLNNSSYGKLLEKPHNQVFANYIDENGIIDSMIIEKTTIEANAKYTYIPVGSAIPAYSRVDLIELALKFGWQKILYFDTDSIFVLYDEETQKVWDKVNQEDFLGGWAIEEMLQRAEFSAPKRYKAIKDNGEVYVKMAGINFAQSDFDFDEVNIDKEQYQIQRAFRCKGGTIVDVQLKEVGVQKKYEETYKANLHKVYEK